MPTAERPLWRTPHGSRAWNCGACKSLTCRFPSHNGKARLRRGKGDLMTSETLYNDSSTPPKEQVNFHSLLEANQARRKAERAQVELLGRLQNDLLVRGTGTYTILKASYQKQCLETAALRQTERIILDNVLDLMQPYIQAAMENDPTIGGP